MNCRKRERQLVSISFDKYANACYVYLDFRESPAHHSKAIGDDVIIDYDEYNSITGIELLGPPAKVQSIQICLETMTNIIMAEATEALNCESS